MKHLENIRAMRIRRWISARTRRVAAMRCAAGLAGVIAAFAVAPAAEACFVVSGFVVDVGGAETPAVCENIFWNGLSGANARFDYQFWVASAGPGSIDFFGFGVPAAIPAVAPTAGNGGTTVFPNATLFAGTPPITAQDNGVFTSNGAPSGWAFDYYNLGGGAYFVDWNDIGNGTLPPNAAFAVNNNPGSIAAGDGSFGVFEVYSPFGPVAGLGVVDPPAGEIFVDIADPKSTALPNGEESLLGTTSSPTDLCEQPGTHVADPNNPTEDLPVCTDPSGNPVGQDPIPEPASLGLFALGALATAYASRRRRFRD
jgi:hypothetical protein